LSSGCYAESAAHISDMKAGRENGFVGSWVERSVMETYSSRISFH